MGRIATRMASEDVIINPAMSFAGAAQRAFRLRRRASTGGSRWASLTMLTIAAAVITLAWWGMVVIWYGTFGLLLAPYRVLRRGARKRKAEALRHRELMERTSSL